MTSDSATIARLCPIAPWKTGSVEGAGVVVEADEPVERAQAVPVEEAVDRGQRDGQQHEGDVDEQGGGEEPDDQQAATAPTWNVARAAC